MKHQSTLLIVLSLILSTTFSFSSNNPKEEFRASWVATVYGIDWPHTQGNASVQKTEMDLILDRAKAANMTAVMFQVRGYSDALYQSTVGEAHGVRCLQEHGGKIRAMTRYPTPSNKHMLVDWSCTHG